MPLISTEQIVISYPEECWFHSKPQSSNQNWSVIAQDEPVLCRDSRWSHNLCLSMMDFFYSVFIMLSNFCKAAYQEAFMIEFNNLTCEPTDFLSHLSPFFKFSVSLHCLSFLKTLKEYVSHCALFLSQYHLCYITIFQSSHLFCFTKYGSSSLLGWNWVQCFLWLLTREYQQNISKIYQVHCFQLNETSYYCLDHIDS